MNYLFTAGLLSFFASLTHIAIIFGGPAWYRFFGAGEQMARMAEQGDIQPTIMTLIIASALACWGAYAWSAAGVLAKLPLLKTGLFLITGVYLVRGILGLFAPLLSDHPQIAQNSTAFWIWSSLICIVFGLVHLKGVIDKWLV